jgi:hypothetical protein
MQLDWSNISFHFAWIIGANFPQLLISVFQFAFSVSILRGG